MLSTKYPGLKYQSNILEVGFLNTVLTCLPSTADKHSRCVISYKDWFWGACCSAVPSPFRRLCCGRVPMPLSHDRHHIPPPFNLPWSNPAPAQPRCLTLTSTMGRSISWWETFHKNWKSRPSLRRIHIGTRGRVL